MKSLLYVLTIFSFVSFSYASICSYKKGETISKRTGYRVFRTITPKVIPDVSKIKMEVSDEDILVTSPMSSLKMDGSMTCDDAELREGFDCFEMNDVKNNKIFRIFIGNRNQKETYLVEDLNITGGAYQEDMYSCIL